ncbi:MAG: NAD(P)H-dependent oxidoreductase [Hoeflea sp.]|uniref:NADPH-dependent FMN reductase n=1 Tax=Hoeflea sp. TaxID=1940281 RepID=UPI001D52EF1E|nr:NADPH-dependent FMN reductase [Hoeflea sp.]MBU4527183.1 NAD(P)H-dependent oxidoreductase [Alphaproteobacteria bacterium]MBU4547034.1 NAD(P)H-dependent oxidoreductase [Alphaproteobacteria bacterium]MBU4551454.1 NAD(P)H-dependent oxidoreductase [Alphaproteobacteria bacterium]MBV1725459.1 NAD(P)H-dependent oxidoreductase [Hoeflea sp.]MBV1759507.1 NAD(P)H-dependent oxidoreductase [Hoeflea sp.]
MTRIAVLVGSLRKDSINRKLAGALEKLAAGRMEFVYADLSELPHYNDDIWENIPDSVTALKATVEAADAVLMVVPEYNRTYPGVIKDAIDWGTRPWGKNSWTGKPAAITGTSPGAIGSAIAQHHLRTTMVTVGTAVMGQPELYYAFKPEHFDANGAVTDDSTRDFLQAWVNSFADWIARTGK